MPVYPQPTAVLFIDPISQYGCAFDHRVTFDGYCNTGTSTTTIGSNTINFTVSDLNKRIVLTGAGVGGAQYVGTIQAIQSSTSVTVSPAVSTTVSSKAVQVHTNDLPAWTNLISDLNNSTYAGGIIQIKAPWVGGAFTGRSGISGFLPTITKQVYIEGFGMAGTSDSGDYTKNGGCCIAYVGTSNAPTAFGAVLTIAPVAGATNQHIDGVVLRNFWIDCRNGDQNEALKGISLQSSFGHTIENVFVNDACAVGMEMLVISPGTSNALGEAKDCSRGMLRNVRFRCLDSPAATPAAATTTTTAVTLSTSGQSFTLAAALTNQPAAGYVWMQTATGYPVLVNYTGGGGTTTLTGCTVSLQDTINTPITVSGSNVVQAHPGNSCALLLDGDTTANANLNHYDTIIVSHGTTWGPAAIDLRNSDSNEFTNVVINGGSNTVINAINRVTKPGVRFNASALSQASGLSSRNNVFKSGSPGAGGFSVMGVNNAGAILTTQSGPTIWEDMQMGNGEPIPTVEGNAYVLWWPNGGTGLPHAPSPVAALTSGQSIAAATATLITGSVIGIPPQGFQIGATYRWTIFAQKTSSAGTASRTFNVRIGTTGTVSDAIVAAITSAAGTAATDVGVFVITMTIVTLGASAAAVCQFWMTHNGNTAGWSTTPSQAVVATMSTFNSTTAQQFISVSLTTGASETATINACMCEVVKPANP